jgi:hypothetical protein
MTGMNRLSPLIARRAEPFLPGSGRGGMLGTVERSASTAPLTTGSSVSAGGQGRRLDDLRLFATGWIGGLIFFGTLIG